MHKRARLELGHIARRHDQAQWRAAWRARDRWLGRWERGFPAYYAMALPPQEGIEDEGFRAWGKEGQKLEKAASDRYPDAGSVINAIEAKVAKDQFVKGAQALYVGLGLDQAQDAGQFTLDALGLNRTFRWAGARNFHRDALAVQGSKIIQHSYGNHIAELANMILDATDPARPKAPGEVAKEIRERWQDITRKQALRIARTETARIWETTNYDVQLHNGVKEVMWLIATGPAIGSPRSEDVCDLCLARKAASPYPIEDAPLPPEHPNCRCTLVPVLSPTWLPPAVPFVGEEPVPPVFKTTFSGHRHVVPPPVGWDIGAARAAA